MLQKIPVARSTVKISNEKECFQIKEHVRTASKMKLLEFKEKNANMNVNDESVPSQKSALMQLNVVCEVTAIMESSSALESSAVNFEELYKNILFISRNLSDMESLKGSIENFILSYPFIEFKSL